MDQMDIERLDQRVTRIRDDALDVRMWLIATIGRLRKDRRAMTMGYVGFTIFIAAGGAIIALYWYRSYMARANGSAGNRLNRNGLPDDPIPPFKKTICGLSEAERKRLEFEQRLERLEKEYQAGTLRLYSRLDSLKGTKYTFVPRSRSESAASRSA